MHILDAVSRSPGLIEGHFLPMIASKEVKCPLHREKCQRFHSLPFNGQLLFRWSSLSCRSCCHKRALSFSSFSFDRAVVALTAADTSWRVP